MHLKKISSHPFPGLLEDLQYLSKYLSNEDVTSSIQRFNTRRFHGDLHEPCNFLDDNLHYSCIV